MKEQSHKDEMSAAIRGNFRRLRERGVAATLAPRDADRPERAPVDVVPGPEPAPEPATEPEADPQVEPGPAGEDPVARPGLFARIFR